MTSGRISGAGIWAWSAQRVAFPRRGRGDVTVPINSVVTCERHRQRRRGVHQRRGPWNVSLVYGRANRKSGRLRYLLEEFEIEPMPVQVVYAQGRLMSSRVRAFVDECVQKLRRVKFD